MSRSARIFLLSLCSFALLLPHGALAFAPACGAFAQLKPPGKATGPGRPNHAPLLKERGSVAEQSRLKGGGLGARIGRSASQRLLSMQGSLRTSSGGLSKNSTDKRFTAVYLLVVVNALVFALQTFGRVPMYGFYLNHAHPAWFQYITSTFCHANAGHLSSNLFPMLVFGRLVEEEMGFIGLILSYIVCGVAANIASILFLPSATLGLGASGAVFGLFTVAVLVRISIRDFAWRSWVEAAVFGQFVWERLRNEVVVTASGGMSGVNHVAHLGGAFAGVVLILGARLLLSALEGDSDKLDKY
mmetsp:Transcript_13239/g.32356  ORF Transcript_13239/g.32356 Transcript_13239/m.32356 type:complete len:301 (-) Transcript_13239:66-968(-)